MAGAEFAVPGNQVAKSASLCSVHAVIFLRLAFADARVARVELCVSLSDWATGGANMADWPAPRLRAGSVASWAR